MLEDQIEIEIFLARNGIRQGDINDIYTHSFSVPAGQTIQDIAKSMCKEGIRKYSSDDSILSTIRLLRPDKSLSEQIERDSAKGKHKVIVKIPQELEDLYLGKCQPKYKPGGHQSERNSLLDYLKFDTIPREFIVGIAYAQNETTSENESQDFVFIENPYFYDNPKNKVKNTAQIVFKIKDKLHKSHGCARILIEGKTVTQDDIDFYKNFGDGDALYHIEQREKFVKQNKSKEHANETENTLIL